MKNYGSGDSKAIPDGPATKDGRPRTIDVRALMAGEQETWLSLDGENYRLRITSKGKLILTK